MFLTRGICYLATNWKQKTTWCESRVLYISVHKSTSIFNCI